MLRVTCQNYLEFSKCEPDYKERIYFAKTIEVRLKPGFLYLRTHNTNKLDPKCILCRHCRVSGHSGIENEKRNWFFYSIPKGFVLDTYTLACDPVSLWSCLSSLKHPSLQRNSTRNRNLLFLHKEHLGEQTYKITFDSTNNWYFPGVSLSQCLLSR